MRTVMNILFQYDWIPVEIRPSQRYFFPGEINSYFRENWGGPAIYRWVVFEHEPGDLRHLYVGEAESLPRRIYGYLNPGPTQRTNQRLKAAFEQQISRGRKVVLDVLNFDPFEIEGVAIAIGDLENKWVRRFLEGLFTMYYSRSGYSVLNA